MASAAYGCHVQYACVSLSHQLKGVHMSRFVEILNSHDRIILREIVRSAWCRAMLDKLETESGGISK